MLEPKLHPISPPGSKLPRIAALAAVIVAGAQLLAGCQSCKDSGPGEDDGTNGFDVQQGETSTSDASDGAGEPGDGVKLSLLGIGPVDGVLCGLGSLEVEVQVEGLEGGAEAAQALLFLVVADQVVLPASDASAASAPSAPSGTAWTLTFDLAGVLDALAGAANGDLVKIGIAWLPQGADTATLPADPDHYVTQDVVLDSEGPTLDLVEPELGGSVPSLTGDADFVGTASDSVQVGEVRITLEQLEASGEGAEPVHFEEVLPAAEGEEKTQSFDTAVDVAALPTDLYTLKVVPVDACGHEGTAIEEVVKIVRLPRLVTMDRWSVTGEPILNDTHVYDWTGDGYPDVLLGTSEGVILAENAGEHKASGDPGDFPATLMRALTPDMQIKALAVIHVGEDADPDLVTVENIAGKDALVLRHFEGGAVAAQEVHELPFLAGATRGLVVADFTADAPDPELEDVVVLTSAQEASVVLFKRNATQSPESFDSEACETEAGVDEETGEATTLTTCPTVLADGAPAGGVEGIVTAIAVDLTGEEGRPDGYMDLLTAAEDLNQVQLWRNSFDSGTPKDTALSAPTPSDVWPVSGQKAQDVQYACAGNFIELGDEDLEDGEIDHLDLVAGTEQSGTWRVLRGKGFGVFATSLDSGHAEDPVNVWSMSGTTGGNIRGAACADFDGDGHDDFAMMSNDTRLVQVHTGDGRGRFGQDEDEPLWNPVSEGAGFVTGLGAARLKAADLDQDGLPDLLMDFGSGGLGVMINQTGDKGYLDFRATRALVSPLGKHSPADGGALVAMAIGDITGDGQAELVATADGGGFPNSQWLKVYHPIGQTYRQWSQPSKLATGPTVFAWTQGTGGDTLPSWPAAYDRIPAALYGDQAKEFGSVTARALRVVDLLRFDGQLAPDGAADLVLAGDASGTPTSHVSLLVNTDPGSGFWAGPGLTSATNAMFKPWNRHLALPSAPSAFSLTGAAGDEVPSLLLAIDQTLNNECPTDTGLLRQCRWAAAPTPGYWQCWENLGCAEETSAMKYVGTQAIHITKLADSESIGPGFPDDDPSTAGDVVVVTGSGGALNYYKQGDPQAPLPLEVQPPITIGNGLNDVAYGDLDADGVVDVAATINNNVFVVFGKTSSSPFSAALPIDIGSKGGPEAIVLSDVNADGFQDIVFTEQGAAQVVIYLAVGADENADYSSEFTEPIEIPSCTQPSEILAWDFDGDGCEALAVLCGGAGSVMLLENTTCSEIGAIPGG